MSVKLGVPSKGRLMEKTFDWFAARGVTLRRTGSEREYAGAVEGIDGLELVLLSAGEIPRELAAGRIHLGVTGSDLVREKLGAWEEKVREMEPLGFGHADLVIAVPTRLGRRDHARRSRRGGGARSGRSTGSGCGSPPSITGWCATTCASTGSPTTSWSTARARPRAR